MEQWSQRFAAVQNDLSNAREGLTQEIFQETAFLQQLCDQILGIPTASNPAFNTAVTQPGNGGSTADTNFSGSGSKSNEPAVKLLPEDSGSPQNENIYDTAGTYTWTAPAGVTSANVELWGAGGGGGGGNSSASHTSYTSNGGYLGVIGQGGGSGGGGGAYTYVGAVSVTPGNQYTVEVGAGGAGGTGDGGLASNGAYGGDSSFSSLSAQGGQNGPGGGGFPGGDGGYGSSDGGVRGTGGFGSGVEGGGGGGGAASACGPGGDGSDGSGATGGAGGAADMSSGAGGAGGNAGSPGNSGQDPGGGGGGGGTGANGGNGADGEVIVFWVNANNNDTLVWNPCKGSTDASQASNWYDQTMGIQGVEAPDANTPVVFNVNTSYSPIVNNSPIVWNQNISLPSISILGYTGLMTINDGLKVEDTGAFSDTKDSWLKVSFGANSVFQLDTGGGDMTSMTLSGNPSGLLDLAGGTTTFASAPNYQYNIGANIYIAGGATLTDESNDTLKFTNTNLTISVVGAMNVEHGTGTGATLLDATGFDNDYINVTDGGILKYLGSGGSIGVTDTFKNVPVLVQDGDLIVTTATGAPNGGKLIVTGTVPNQDNKASVYVTGDGSSKVQMANGGTNANPEILECDDGYYQDSGTLETMDAASYRLQVGAAGAGTANITGGSVKIDQPNVGYGQLTVRAPTLNFDGELVVAIDASKPDDGNNLGGTSDKLYVSGTANLQANSTLTVFVNNAPPAPSNQWVIIKDTNPIQPANFVMPITTVPQTNLGDKVAPKDNTKYIVTS